MIYIGSILFLTLLAAVVLIVKIPIISFDAIFNRVTTNNQAIYFKDCGELFEVIKNANTSNNNTSNNNHNTAVSLNSLRDDVVIDSPQIEKQIIIENFPKEKNGYLVVSKVIEE